MPITRYANKTADKNSQSLSEFKLIVLTVVINKLCVE